MTYTSIFSLTDALETSYQLLNGYPEIKLIVTLAVAFGLGTWIIRLVKGGKKK